MQDLNSYSFNTDVAFLKASCRCLRLLDLSPSIIYGIWNDFIDGFYYADDNFSSANYWKGVVLILVAIEPGVGGERFYGIVSILM